MAKLDPKVKKQLEEQKPKILDWLHENVSEKRFAHIIRVSQTAKKYAKQLKLDHNKAELSGLLHDCAKEYKNTTLLQIAKSKQIPLEELDISQPHILHARVGAIVAKEKFKIKDPDVLGGIRCHTLAEPYMSKLQMVVFLADATEPARDKKKIIPIKKTLKKKGLEHAVLEAINNKLQWMIKKGGKIHPITIHARNWIISEVRTR